MKTWYTVASLVLVVIALAGCGGSQVPPVNEEDAARPTGTSVTHTTSTPHPTSTPQPTSTSPPIIVPTETATPASIPTAMPTEAPASPSAGAAPADTSPGILDISYPDALSVSNQLVLGTVLLEETEHAVTPEQASALLPLWQALQGGVTTQAEAQAVLRQIKEAMTPEQLEAIAAMQLTREDLRTWMQEHGLSMGPGPGAGGGGQGMPPGAPPGPPGESPDRAPPPPADLLESLIKLLSQRAVEGD